MLETIFYYVDDFCKEYENFETKVLLEQSKKKSRNAGTMLLSEIMTISIYFHHSGYKTFKVYYENLIQGSLKSAFGNVVSYNRFTELMQKAMLPFFIFASLTGKTSILKGIYIVDSYSLKVCHNKRISQHKLFKKLAKRGKTSMGWFFGFKLHVIINHLGEIIAFAITPGNVADNNEDLMSQLTEGLMGKLFGDKGYISEKLFRDLWHRGLQLITKIRKNMKNKLMDIYDKLLLRKRGVVESVGNILKNIYNLEHTRHRNISNFFVNIFSTIGAYFFKENKPAISKQDIACLKGLC
jgi:hypothetical protein